MVVDQASAIFMGIRTDSSMYKAIDMPMFISSQVAPKFSLIGLKVWPAWFNKCPRSKMVQHGAKSGSGRLVHKSGQAAILDQYADQYADPWDRFWEASWGHVGAYVGLMLASFFVMIFWCRSDVVLDPNMVGKRSQNRVQDVQISDSEIDAKNDRKCI